MKKNGGGPLPTHVFESACMNDKVTNDEIKFFF